MNKLLNENLVYVLYDPKISIIVQKVDLVYSVMMTFYKEERKRENEKKTKRHFITCCRDDDASRSHFSLYDIYRKICASI